jgi:hypothetical protein
MKTNLTSTCLGLGIGLLPMNVMAQGLEPVEVTCQLETSDSSKVYSLTAAVSPQEGSFKVKTTAWSEKNGFEVIAEDSNKSFHTMWSDVEVSGEDGSKSLVLSGGSSFLSRAGRPVVTSDFVIHLVQVVHPEDGSRAAGAIFHGINGIKSLDNNLLPSGVTLTGLGNCWDHSGLGSYHF